MAQFSRSQGHNVSKLTLFTWYFLQFFANGVQIFIYGDHGKYLELINFSWLWLNFQSHRGSLCFKIKLCLRNIFCSFVLMACKLRHLVNIDKTFNWLTFHDHASVFKVTAGRYISKLFILLYLCNSKTIEASTFAVNTLFGYFLV